MASPWQTIQQYLQGQQVQQKEEQASSPWATVQQYLQGESAPAGRPPILTFREYEQALQRGQIQPAAPHQPPEAPPGGFLMPLPQTPYLQGLGLPTAVEVPGWLAWVMRQLMRPESAMVAPLLDIAQTVQQVRSGEAEPMEYLRALGRVPVRMYEGFMAETPYSYYDLLTQMFPESPEWVRALGGFGLSVVADPLTYMSFFRRAAEGGRVLVSVGDRTVIQGDRLIRAMEALWRRAQDTPLGMEIRQKFSRRIGPEGYSELRDDFINLLHYEVQRAQERGLDFHRAVQEISRETGLTPEEISQLWERPVLYRTETRQVVEQVPVEQRVVEREVPQVGRAVESVDVSAPSRTIAGTPPMRDVSKPSIAGSVEALPGTVSSAQRPMEILQETVRQIPLHTEPFTYKVQRGDTLSQIAQRHYVTLEELLQANPQITDPNRIRAGQNITIPVPSHIRQLYDEIRQLESLQNWHIQEELRAMRHELAQGERGRRVPVTQERLFGPAEMTGEWLAEGSTYPDWFRRMTTTTKSKESVLQAIDQLLENPAYRERSSLADELWEIAHNRLLQGSQETYYFPREPDQAYIELLNWQQQMADELRQAATVTERERVIRRWEERIRTERQRVGVPVLRQAPPEVQQLIADMRAWNEAAAQRLEQAGIPLTRFEHDEIEYLAHVITPEARKILTGKRNPQQWTQVEVRRVMDWDVRDRHGQQRRLRDMTIQEANEAFREKYGVNLFISDPAIATTMRVISAQKAAVSAEFLKAVTSNPDFAVRVAYRVQEGETLGQIAEKLGTTVDDLLARNPRLGRVRAAGDRRQQVLIPETAADIQPRRLGIDTLNVADPPPGWRPVEGKRFSPFTEGFVFHPEVAKDLQGFIRILDPDEINAFWSLYDRYMELWRVNALAWYPGYHLRNVVGNVLNNFAAGVKDPRVYEAAFWAWRGRQGGNIKLPRAVELPDGTVTDTLTYAQLADLAARHGARGRGQYATVRQLVQQAGEERRPWWSPFAVRGRTPSEWMFAVQEAQEDVTRMAHFLDRLLKGDTPQQAGASVRKYLFDYSTYGLTEFERTRMRRLVGFWTWTKNNLPLQFEILFTRPGIAAMRPKAFRAVEQAFGGEEQAIPPEQLDEFIAGGMPVRVGTTPEGFPRYWRTVNWDPFADLAQISTPNEFWRFAGGSLAPIPQAIIEAMTGQSLSFSGDTERYPGQLTTLPGLPNVVVPERVAQPASTLVPGFRALYELQRANPFGIADPNDPRTAAERVAATMGLRLYSRDPEAARRRTQVAWEKRLQGLAWDFRRADSPRLRQAIRSQILEHVATADMRQWTVEEFVDVMGLLMWMAQQAFVEQDNEAGELLVEIWRMLAERW